MDCRKTRDEIEKIEDLKKKEHLVPDGVATHLKDCRNCEEYHHSSGEWERQLFSKIKDLKMPAAPSAASLMPRKSRWRNLLVVAPLAAAAALLIIVGLTPYDFTGEIFQKAVSHSLGIEKAYAEEIDQPMEEFRKATGLQPAPPENLRNIKPEKACLVDIRGRKVLALLYRHEGKRMHVFVYRGQLGDWKCCPGQHCRCLSNALAEAERWKSGKLGYLTIMPGKEGACRGCCNETPIK